MKLLLEHLSRRSYPVVWITATHCSIVCPTILSGEFSPSITPLLGFSLEPDDAIISRRFCGSCTGFLSRDVLTTKWHVLSFRLCLATHLRTSPTTYIWSPMVLDGGYALPPTDRVPFHATEASQSPGHVFGTYNSFRRELKTFLF